MSTTDIRRNRWRLTPDVLQALERVIVVVSLIWQDKVEVLGDRGTLVRALEAVSAVERSRHLVSSDVLVRCRTGPLANR